MKLRTKNPNPIHCTGAEPLPYGKFVIKAEVIPVPIIAACQAQVKWLYDRFRATISGLREVPKEQKTHRIRSLQGFSGFKGKP